jgi:hypothetical protein
MLAIGVAGAAVLFGAMRGFERYRKNVADNEQTATKAATALDDAKFAMQRGQKADQRLRDLDRRSLPTDPDVAESLYQDWLRKQLTEAGLQEVQVTDKTYNRRNANFSEITTEAKASGQVEQFTAFLYKFYASPHLHRISGATLTPSDNGAKLAIVLTVDALVLPEATRKSELSKAEPQKLPRPRMRSKRASPAATCSSRTPRAPIPMRASPASAKLSGIISDGKGGFLLWVTTESPAKTRKFRIGDKLDYGSFKGKLVELDFRGGRAVFETDNGNVEALLDHTLAEAKPVEKDKSKEEDKEKT